MLIPGTLLHDRYEILREIGKGGMGAVYAALDRSLNRQVAIKQNRVTNADGDEQFRHEAQTLAQLRHPNLPIVYDYFLDAQSGYLVMDFVDGQNLYDIVEKNGPLTEPDPVLIFLQIIDAVKYLHAHHVIHRDIKPNNIILTSESKAMLVDFGIAKVYKSDQVTQPAAQRVTPGFSPLEQYIGSRTTERSDIYSISITSAKARQVIRMRVGWL